MLNPITDDDKVLVERPARLLVLDTDLGKVIANLPGAADIPKTTCKGQSVFRGLRVPEVS
jgi:hypothetical protein